MRTIIYQDDWLTLADRFETSHTPTIVMPRRGMRTGTISPMPSSSIPTNLPLMSTSSSYQPSSYQTNLTWPLQFASTPPIQYPGNQAKPGKYCLKSEMTPPSAPITSGPQYDDYEAMMELWHRFTVNQMLRGEPVLMPYGVHHLRNNPRYIGEMREDAHEGPRHRTLEATPEDHVQAKQFDKQLDQVLLLVDYIQTRTRIFELIDELEVMTEKLANIALGLERNSTHGTP